MLGAMFRSRLVDPFTMFIHIVRYSLVCALCTISPVLILPSRLWNHRPQSHTRPTNATLKALGLISIENFPTVLGLYYIWAEMFFVGERMKMGKVKVQTYQKHPKVQVFWDMGKKNWIITTWQYESVTLIIICQSQKTRDFSISSRRSLQSRENHVVGLVHTTGADYTFLACVAHYTRFCEPCNQ